MRIEIACSSRELFGSDRSALRLARLLAELGHEVSLALPAQRPERGLTEFARAAGTDATPEPVVVASSRGISGVRGPRGARRSAAELTIYNSLAVAARLGDAPPRVAIVREWLEPRWRRHRALARWHRRRAQLVVAVSRGVAARWRECAGAGPPVEVCPNWLDDSWLELEPNGERTGVLFAGRLSAWKGQLVLADAFERAFAETPTRPQLTFVGAEEPPSPFAHHAAKLRTRCEQHGWELLPFTPDPRPHLARAAVVVVPSLHPEPFGNVILEGLAAGARVIAFPGGGADDMAPLFPGALELVSRGTDPLAAALARWWELGGPAQSPAERQATRAVVRERFTAPAMRPRWEELVGAARRADQSRRPRASRSARA